MNAIKTLLVIAIIVWFNNARALVAPQTYTCSNDAIGNCICTQNQSNYFPKRVEPGVYCPGKTKMRLHGDLVTVRPSDGRTSVSYTIFGDKQVMLVDSLQPLKIGKSQYWDRDESVWECQDAKLCDLSMKNS